MAITINGTGTITGISAGGLPDGVITSDDLASGAITAAGLPAGSILQVVQTVKTDTTSAQTSSYADISGMSATITPSSTNSKVLVMVSAEVSCNYYFHIRLLRGTTPICVGDANSNRTQVTMGAFPGDTSWGSFYWGSIPQNMNFLDSPATTSATTYKLQWKYNGGTNLFLNRTYEFVDQASQSAGASTIILMEVAG